MFAFLSLTPAAARAQSAGDADAMIERAIDLREAGNDLEARTLLREAYALSPTPRAAAQLGLVEQALGLWVDAERHLVEAISRANDQWVARRRQLLDQSLSIVRENLGSLEILANVEGAVVLIRGTRVATLPLSAPLRLPAGRAEIEIRANGHQTLTFSIVIPVAGFARQLVELQPESANEARPMTPEPDRETEPTGDENRTPEASAGGPSFVWSWAALAVTGAAGGVAIALGVHTVSVYDGLSSSCGGAGCSEAQLGASGLADVQLATNALVVVTGALTIVTVLAFVLEGTAGRIVQVSLGPSGVRVGGTF